MANNDDDNTLITAAAIGGGALALWLLLRGRGGRGLGGGGGGKGGGSSPSGAMGAASPSAAPAAGPASRPNGPPCKVFIREWDKIELNGVPADLATVVAACRAVGSAEVGGTGAARTGTFWDVARALNAANVAILPVGDPDIASTIYDGLSRRYDP